MANSIKFYFEGELIVIRPHIYTSILHVGDRFAGYLDYTSHLGCLIRPEGKIEGKILIAIAGAMDQWEEETTHIPLESHRRITAAIKETYKRYNR